MAKWITAYTYRIMGCTQTEYATHLTYADAKDDAERLLRIAKTAQVLVCEVKAIVNSSPTWVLET